MRWSREIGWITTLALRGGCGGLARGLLATPFEAVRVAALDRHAGAIVVARGSRGEARTFICADVQLDTGVAFIDGLVGDRERSTVRYGDAERDRRGGEGLRDTLTSLRAALTHLCAASLARSGPVTPYVASWSG